MWQPGSYTFTAGDNQTEVAFADGGEPNSQGTFLDNTGLYCVAEKPEKPSCSLKMVSNDRTVVVQRNAFATSTYDGNDAWTATIDDADWIWADPQVQNPEGTETYTFQETFEVDGPTNAILEVAADNGYVIYINGEEYEDRSGIGNNYQTHSQKTFDITSELKSGTNTLAIMVTNNAQSGGTYVSNPAGVLYKLTLDGLDDSCRVTTDVVPEEPETFVIEGYKWEDVDGDGERDAEDAGYEGWTIFASSSDELLSTTTDKDGYYRFEVAAGSWQVYEDEPSDWEQTYISPMADGGICYYRFSSDDILFETAQARDYDPMCTFGNHFIGGNSSSVTTFSSSGGGTRTDRYDGRGGNPELPDPQVEGAQAGDPRVLGEQVSVVPAGAPNAGHGGAAPSATPLTLAYLLYGARREAAETCA